LRRASSVERINVLTQRMHYAHVKKRKSEF
jgi:hypothetical protein